MSKYAANLLIKMEPGISPEASREVEDKLREEFGVISARTSDNVGHLMLVEYDTREIDSQGILARMRREGIPVRLIGM